MVDVEIKRKAREIDAKGKEKQRLEQERISKQDRKSYKNVFILVIVLGAVLVGFMIFAPESLLFIMWFITGSDGSRDTQHLYTNNYFPEKTTPYPFPGPNSNQKTYTNSINMDFVMILTGEFDMGSPSDEWDRYDREGPVHRVKIPDGFYLGKYEVTQKQWLDVMGDNPSFFKGDDRPVESVSWNDVQEFINKLNTKEGADRYRLPSEAEWEYAARAGTTTRYSFGEMEVAVCESGDGCEYVDVEAFLKKIDMDNKARLDEHAWNKNNSDGKTYPVGQKKQNPWGLYDMHGNVWEWVQDSYHGNYIGSPTDGSAWESGNGWFWDLLGPKKVFRGGSWYGNNCCRSATRIFRHPDGRNQALGFRLLRAL